MIIAKYRRLHFGITLEGWDEGVRIRNEIVMICFVENTAVLTERTEDMQIINIISLKNKQKLLSVIIRKTKFSVSLEKT